MANSSANALMSGLFAARFFVKRAGQSSRLLAAFFLVSILVGCGGAKVLSEPVALEISHPLAATTDQDVSGMVNWVIVRDGPGSWAKNVDWDEYLIQVVNNSEEEIQVTDVLLVDSLGTRLVPRSERKQLVKDSRETVRRYKDSNIKIEAGIGSGTMIATGTAVAVAVPSVAGAVVLAGLPASITTLGGALAVGTGAMVVGPALIIGGIVRANNNYKVDQEIERRHSVLPVTTPAKQALNLDVFFPLAPSPSRLEIAYVRAGAQEVLILDTSNALNGLHLRQDQ